MLWCPDNCIERFCLVLCHTPVRFGSPVSPFTQTLNYSRSKLTGQSKATERINEILIVMKCNNQLPVVELMGQKRKKLTCSL